MKCTSPSRTTILQLLQLAFAGLEYRRASGGIDYLTLAMWCLTDCWNHDRGQWKAALMDANLLMICSLTFIIHMVGTLAYAVRIAGVRTRRIAISFSFFNILILVSRTSNSFQGPFLAKRIESRLLAGHASSPLLYDFRWLLLTTTLTTLVGAVLIPTFQGSGSKLVLGEDRFWQEASADQFDAGAPIHLTLKWSSTG